MLGLRDVRDLQPAEKQIEKRDPQGQLWAFDPDACCALRKVEPLDEAMIPFDAWITGRKRSQAATRQGLPVVEEAPGGKIKINPLIAWTPRELDAEITRRNLPRHPLTLRGYPSIGCAPCTRPVTGRRGSAPGPLGRASQDRMRHSSPYPFIRVGFPLSPAGTAISFSFP